MSPLGLPLATRTTWWLISKIVSVSSLLNLALKRFDSFEYDVVRPALASSHIFFKERPITATFVAIFSLLTFLPVISFVLFVAAFAFLSFLLTALLITGLVTFAYRLLCLALVSLTGLLHSPSSNPSVNNPVRQT
ncbi:hypothetical protein JOM56_004412 [Amanita muscaria]